MQLCLLKSGWCSQTWPIKAKSPCSSSARQSWAAIAGCLRRPGCITSWMVRVPTPVCSCVTSSAPETDKSNCKYLTWLFYATGGALSTVLTRLCAAACAINVLKDLAAAYIGKGTLPAPQVQRFGWASDLAKAVHAMGEPVPDALLDPSLAGTLPKVGHSMSTCADHACCPMTA